MGTVRLHVPVAVRPTGDPSIATHELSPSTYTEALPSGAAAPLAAVTAKVTATGWPYTLVAVDVAFPLPCGLTTVTTVVVGVVPPPVTVWLTPGDTLPAKAMLSPKLVAISVFVPAVVGVRLQLAGCPTRTFTLQMALPSLTCTSMGLALETPGGVTATDTVTAIGEFTTEGSGVCAVMVVVVTALFTVKLPLPGPLLALEANVAVPV